jgi:hypothetical protein
MIATRQPEQALLSIPAASSPKNDREAIVLSELHALTATTQDRQEGHWIPMHSLKWRKLIGSRYASDISSLLARDEMERNPRYSVERFPKSYRLAKSNRIPQTRTYELSSPTPTFRIRLAEDDSVGRHLVQQFRRVRRRGGGQRGDSRWIDNRCPTQSLPMGVRDFRGAPHSAAHKPAAHQLASMSSVQGNNSRSKQNSFGSLSPLQRSRKTSW